MSESTEWVPKKGDRVEGTKIYSGKLGTGTFDHIRDFEGRNIAILWEGEALEASTIRPASDDLGDTPEHLRPLLRDVRKETPGMVVIDDGTRAPYLMRPNGEWSCVDIETRRQSDWNPGKREDWICIYITEGKVYPTDDARRIGRQEFGMVFEDGDTPAPVPTRCLTSPIFDTRPTCSQCAARIDPRLDGDDTCSAACHQAKLSKLRELERKARHEESEHVYRDIRANEQLRAQATNVRVPRLAPPPVQRVSIAQAAPLNPAALPGVCGVRGKRKSKTTAPASWPEDAGWDEP